MPTFNLSWRGSPRGRPNIRLAPVTTPICPSTTAGEAVLKRPLSPRMSKLRRAQQALVGTRHRVNNRNSKVRVSFQRSSTPSSLHPSMTRTSLHVPKSPSNTGVCMNWVPSQTPRRPDAAPLPPVRRRGGLQRGNAPVQQASDPKRPVKFVKPTAEGEDAKYSLMQVPEGSDSHVLRPQRKDEYAHVGSLDGSTMESSKLPPQNTRRHGRYIVRAPSKWRHADQQDALESGALGILQRQQTSSRPRKDQISSAIPDSLVKESVRRSLSQQDRLSCVSTTTRAKSRATTASSPSGHHQGRSLSRFTKELERYSMVSNAGGQVKILPSTPTVSESPTTMDTLIDLLPYHKQFKAAGLAVTSREQMPRIQEFGVHCISKAGDAKTIVTQVDGSNVTPSDQDSVSQEPTLPKINNKQESGPSNLRPKPQASFSDSGPVIGSLLPSFRKEPRQPSSRTHSDRKFSKGHIHPSLPTPAEPFLTLEDKLGRLDSYFDAPKSKTPQEQPDLQKTPLPLPACSARSTLTDKPLPRKPPIERRPIPARSGRRHMENTADWPTAGVLIHDHYPCPPCRDELSILSGDRQAAKAKATVSVQSWTSHGEFPQEPRRTPPSPPGQESKPETPPKDLPLKEDKSPAGCHQQPGHFAYGNHHKATGLRRRLTAKPPHCAPAAIRDDSEIISEDAKQLVSRQNEVQPERDPAPQLHVTLPGSSSSFEKALDAVVSKLDAMEDSRRYERKQNLEASQIEALNTATTPGYADLEGTSSKPSSTPHSQHPTLIAAQATRTASSDAVEGSDSGINDRDIFIGLKMAICAACDEDLDAWIREKTGLRLRRFLADLKAFEIVSRERELSVPLPLSRRIRTHDKVNKRVESERERGKRVSKKWAPCFGADGQGLLPESSQEM